MLPPLPRCSSWAYSSLISPSRVSLPRKGRRVGLHIDIFEACSAFRGRDGHCWPPPAQIRTCPIKASGSYLGCLTANVRGPTPGSHEPGSASGACFVGPRFPWSPALAPPTPPLVARLCSSASSLLCRSQTSLDRASVASDLHLPPPNHPATT